MNAITKIDVRYANLKSRNIATYLIDHDILSLFFQEKASISPILKASAEHDKHALSLWMLVRYLAFEYANCPLPLNHPYYYRDERFEKIRQLIGLLSEIYPVHASTLTNIKDAVDRLSNCSDNPLLENMESTIGFDDAALILINPDYTFAVSEMCEGYGLKLKINVPGAETFNTTKGIFCGCAKYFPPHVFWAPEHSELHLVRYAWFHDYIRSFHEPHGQLRKPTAPSSVVRRRPPSFYEEPEVDAAIPTEDFNIAMFEQYTDQVSAQPNAEIIESKVVILKGGKFVFLPAEDGYTHHCLVNLDSEPFPRKLKISEFDQHTAVLLKERGEGDYVVEVANQVLLDKAPYFRGQQQRWKKALRERVEAVADFAAISEELKKTGCSTAHTYNIRNWLSPRSIRPESDADFACLLNFLNLTSETKELIRCMDIIRSAHIKAGHRISDQLDILVRNDANLKSILTDGYRIYRLDDISGKVGVYIFDRILPKTVIVSFAEIGQLKSVEALYG